jgi:sporulation protein YabP
VEDNMDKNENYNHEISIKDRNLLRLTGVNKIESFDDEEFLMETVMGFLVIKGENLEIVKLDTKEGIVSIKGSIISLSYIDEIKKQNKENNTFGKLFR